MNRTTLVAIAATVALSLPAFAATTPTNHAKRHHLLAASTIHAKCPAPYAPQGCFDPSQVISSKNHSSSAIVGNNPMANGKAAAAAQTPAAYQTKVGNNPMVNAGAGH